MVTSMDKFWFVRDLQYEQSLLLKYTRLASCPECCRATDGVAQFTNVVIAIGAIRQNFNGQIKECCTVRKSYRNTVSGIDLSIVWRDGHTEILDSFWLPIWSSLVSNLSEFGLLD
jgi:hypothetical protein